MHYLYIVYSKKINRYYIGETPNVDIRINLHNKHHFKKGFTKAANDWIVVLNYHCNSKTEALFLEKFIKRMKSKTFIEKIVENNSILENILTKM